MIINKKPKEIKELTPAQVQVLLERQVEIEQEATDGDFNNWEWENCKYLGISYQEYWLKYLWEYLGFVDYVMEEKDLLSQKELYLKGEHHNQELIKELSE